MITNDTNPIFLESILLSLRSKIEIKINFEIKMKKLDRFQNDSKKFVRRSVKRLIEKKMREGFVKKVRFEVNNVSRKLLDFSYLSSRTLVSLISQRRRRASNAG